jgi:4-amino-4-deoxy-L-arabinose transferase-like glycosyltransferase
MAPLVGPLADEHPAMAVMAARSANALLTGVLVVAAAWAAAQAVRSRRRLTAVVAAAVASTFSTVIFVGGTVNNDPVSTITAVLAAGIGVAMVRRGFSPRLVVAATAVAGLGILTRTTFVLPLAALLLAIFLAAMVETRRSIWLRLGHAAGIAALVGAAALLAGGWFFLRNYRLSGSFAGVRSDYAVEQLGRQRHSFLEAAREPVLWITQRAMLRHPMDGRLEASGSRLRVDGAVMTNLYTCLLLTGLVIAVVVMARALRRRDWRQVAVLAVLAFLVVASLALQIQYVALAGGSGTRYTLQALLPLLLLVVQVFRSLPQRLTTLALAGYLVLCHGFMLWWLADRPHIGIGEAVHIKPFTRAQRLLPWDDAPVPGAVLWVTMSVVVILVGVQVACVHRLVSRPIHPNPRVSDVSSAQ